MLRIVAASFLALVAAGEPLFAEDGHTRPIPTCTTVEPEAKIVRTGELRYLVPKHAKEKHVKDIDYSEYLVLLNHKGKWEALLLFSGNGSPYSLCSAARHEMLRLPNGRDGVDARCESSTNGGAKQSRSTGFMSEYASYESVSPESAKYFDKIIDSMCYAPSRK